MKTYYAGLSILLISLIKLNYIKSLETDFRILPSNNQPSPGNNYSIILSLVNFFDLFKILIDNFLKYK
jgi:hypothetical protein